nr:MAG TPA: hypothetical protein [Caudoviricetes sp.]DAS20393.1 MAG TPA: hypothetical protein [Caudoviricetes sp.]
MNCWQASLSVTGESACRFIRYFGNVHSALR